MAKALAFVFVALVCLTNAFNPPHYNQGDPRWGSQILGFGPSTIAAAGCLLTSVSSMVAGEGLYVDGAVPNPGNMNSWLKTHKGFDGDLFIWASVAPLGMNFSGFTKDKNAIISAMNEGKIAILNVRNGQHYVLATGYNGSGYTVMDPANFQSIYTYGEVVNCGLYTR